MLCRSANSATLNFYPRPPRGGRPLLVGIPPTVRIISIHALREEGDCSVVQDVCAGSHFYPRPPRGGRLDDFQSLVLIRDISIHALREEGDCHRYGLKFYSGEFLSTPSARRATKTL